MKRYLFLALIVSACSPAPEPAKPAASAATPAPAFDQRVAFSRKTEIARDSFAVLIPAGAKPAGVEKAAHDVCRGKDFCKVFGFVDADALPSGFPMTDREVAAQVYSYSLNRQSGMDESLWSCTAFQGVPDGRCLSL